MSLLSELNETNFQAEVLQSPLPILVDFWAPWCGPCRKQGPVLEQLATEHAESVKVAQLNVDESPDLAAAYGIDSISPHCSFFTTEKLLLDWSGCGRSPISNGHSSDTPHDTSSTHSDSPLRMRVATEAAWLVPSRARPRGFDVSDVRDAARMRPLFRDRSKCR